MDNTKENIEIYMMAIMHAAIITQPTALPSPTGNIISQEYSYNAGTYGDIKNPINADGIIINHMYSSSSKSIVTIIKIIPRIEENIVNNRKTLYLFKIDPPATAPII